MTQDQEFDILLKEVTLGFISLDVPNFKDIQGKKPEEIKRIITIKQIKGNAKNILYGNELVTEPDIMDFSLDWWKYSKIYGIMVRDEDKGEEYLWQLLQAKTVAAPPDPLLPNPLEDFFKPISRKTQDKISPIPKPPEIPPPDLTWRYPLGKPLPPSYDGEKLSDLGIWYHPQEEKWWKDALVSTVALAAGLFLSRYSETIEAVTEEEFAEWPPKAPGCWTACAEGEPIYNRPTLPETKMAIAEWEKQNLARWYLTPGITERIISPERKSWTAYGRYIAFTVSIDFAARALRKAFWQKEQFPE